MQQVEHIERETRKFRLFALLLVAVGLAFEQDPTALLPGLAVTAAYLGYSFLLLFAIVRRVPARWSPYLLLVVDTAFVGGTLLIFGVTSPAFILMPVVIIYYGLYLGYAGSFVSATLVAFAYIGIAFSQGADLVLGRMLPVQLPLFYLIALFSGFGAQLRRRAQREGEELSVLLQAERSARAALEATSGISELISIDTLSTALAELAARAAGCQLAVVRAANRGEGVPGEVVAAFAGASESGSGAGDHRFAEPGLLERAAFAERRTLEALNPSVQQLGGAPVPLPSYALVVPLVADPDTVGTLMLLDFKRTRKIAATQLRLVESLALFFAKLAYYSLGFSTARSQSDRISGELRGAVEQIARRQHFQHKGDVRVGTLLLEPARQAAYIDDKRLQLTPREFDVLYVLARRAGDAVSQEVLLREVWGDQTTTRSNLIDVAINRLRRKLREQAMLGDVVQTVRGKGYRLDLHSSGLFNGSAKASGGRFQLRRQGQRGSLILEHVISLAIVAIVVPALLAALSAVINHAFEYGDRTQLLELAQNQMESVKKQTFQPSPASYALISSVPQDYSVSVATSEAQRYVYPDGSIAPEVLQAITVTVAGYNGSLTAAGYRYRE